MERRACELCKRHAKRDAQCQDTPQGWANGIMQRPRRASARRPSPFLLVTAPSPRSRAGCSARTRPDKVGAELAEEAARVPPQVVTVEGDDVVGRLLLLALPRREEKLIAVLEEDLVPAINQSINPSRRREAEGESFLAPRNGISRRRVRARGSVGAGVRPRRAREVGNRGGGHAEVDMPRGPRSDGFSRAGGGRAGAAHVGNKRASPVFRRWM